MPKNNRREKGKLPQLRRAHVRPATQTTPIKGKKAPGTGNPYRKKLHEDGRLYGKYKEYPNTQIPVQDLQAALEGRPLTSGHKPHFAKPLRDKSFTIFVFHTGSRKLEPTAVKKEDVILTDTHLVVNIPAFKHGKRAGPLELNRTWAGIDLIIEQWKKTRKGRPIWEMSPNTAYRIIKRALGCCPHWLRHNWITTMQQQLTGQPSEVDRTIMAWTGHKRRESLDHYRMKKQEDITKISQVGLQGTTQELSVR